MFYIVFAQFESFACDHVENLFLFKEIYVQIFPIGINKFFLLLVSLCFGLVWHMGITPMLCRHLLNEFIGENQHVVLLYGKFTRLLAYVWPVKEIFFKQQKFWFDFSNRILIILLYICFLQSGWFFSSLNFIWNIWWK